ncbi:hypothetical protein TYRP_011770 [Tyrophagus putrescentiae]|nr:hypothetical protein TYRP_011770 [Tyrophagus putrescentiae]
MNQFEKLYKSSSIHIGWEDIPVGDPRLRMAIEAVKGKIGGIGPDVQYTVISATALQPGPLKYQTKVLFAKDTGITCDLTIAVNMGGVYELVKDKLENGEVNWHDIPVADLGLKRALEGVQLIDDPSEYAVVWAQAKIKNPLEYKAKVLMKKTRTTCEVQVATKSVKPTQYKLVTETCAPLFGKPQLGSDSPVLYKRDCEYENRAEVQVNPSPLVLKQDCEYAGEGDFFLSLLDATEELEEAVFDKAVEAAVEEEESAIFSRGCIFFRSPPPCWNCCCFLTSWTVRAEEEAKEDDE